MFWTIVFAIIVALAIWHFGIPLFIKAADSSAVRKTVWTIVKVALVVIGLVVVLVLVHEAKRQAKYQEYVRTHPHTHGYQEQKVTLYATPECTYCKPSITVNVDDIRKYKHQYNGYAYDPDQKVWVEDDNGREVQITVEKYLLTH